MCKATRPRTRSRPSDCRVAPSPAQTSAAAPATAVGRAQIVGAKRLSGPGRCARSGRRSVHCPPTSFAHAGTAISGGRTGGGWRFWRAGRRPWPTSAMVAEDAAFRNARENSDRENAPVEAENAIQRALVAIMNDDTRLFGEFSGESDSKRWLTNAAFPARPRGDGLRSANGLRRPCRGVFSHPVGDGRRQLPDAIRPPRRYRTIADSRRVDCLAGDPSAFRAWIRRSTRSPRESARPLGIPTSRPRRLPRRIPGASGTAGDLARTASRGDIPGAQIVRSIERGIE